MIHHFSDRYKGIQSGGIGVEGGGERGESDESEKGDR
jgi:hypothetical protein